MMIDQKELHKILPQSYPFLLIDRVLEYKKGESLVAVKNITSNEWSSLGFEGEVHHFPETLIIEAAAQAAIILYHKAELQQDSKPKYLFGKAKADFLRPVFIGDQLKIKLQAGKLLSTGGFATAQAKVADEKVADIEMFFSVQKN